MARDICRATAEQLPWARRPRDWKAARCPPPWAKEEAGPQRGEAPCHPFSQPRPDRTGRAQRLLSTRPGAHNGASPSAVLDSSSDSLFCPRLSAPAFLLQSWPCPFFLLVGVLTGVRGLSCQARPSPAGNPWAGLLSSLASVPLSVTWRYYQRPPHRLEASEVMEP